MEVHVVTALSQLHVEIIDAVNPDDLFLLYSATKTTRHILRRQLRFLVLFCILFAQRVLLPEEQSQLTRQLASIGICEFQRLQAHVQKICILGQLTSYTLWNKSRK